MKMRTALKVWFEVADCHRDGTVTRYRESTVLRASRRFSGYVRHSLLAMYYRQHPRSGA